jgi:hypothetical protein
MKKLLFAAILASLLAGCGNDKVIEGVHYPTFGVANDDAQRNPKIQYEISAGSVIWAVLLCETIVFPIYIIGWDLYQPVKVKVFSPV